MKNVRILHLSDVHFDTPFRELPKEIAILRRNEIRECFSRIIDKAIEKKVDLILLAGDIFDNDTVEKNTLVFIKEQMEKANLYNIKIFISSGNHDPYNAKSFYNMIKWSENVHIFKNTMERVVLEELGVVIYGQSFKEKYQRKSMLKDFEPNCEDGDLVRIMLLHGEVKNGENSEYNKISLNEIEKSGMDYIALGHIHRFSGINKIGNTTYAYSGCPEGRGFDELGKKGVIIGELSKGATELNFMKMNKREYVIKEVDISDFETKEDIIEELLTIPREKRMRNLFKIKLKGRVKEHFNLDLFLLENMLKEEFFYFKIIDETKPFLNMDELSNEYSMRGIFCSLMKEAIYEKEYEDEILEMAFKIGMESLLDGEVNLDED